MGKSASRSASPEESIAFKKHTTNTSDKNSAREGLLRHFNMLTATLSPNNNTALPKELSHDAAESYMCKTELNKTLQMCGLEEDKERLLPCWLQNVFEKGTNDNTNNQIIIATMKKVL